MIFGFDLPHKIGSICNFPCKQCNDDPNNPELSEMTGSDGRIDYQPLRIIKESSKEAYIEFCKSVNGKLKVPLHPKFKYFYEVETD